MTKQQFKMYTVKLKNSARVFPFIALSLFSLGCTTTYQGLKSLRSPKYESQSKKYSEADYKRRSTQQNFSPRWPVKRAKLTTKFELPEHHGIDLANRRGTKIIASHDADVIYVGSGFSGYGKMVILEFNKQWATLYAHLDRFNVKEGEVVKRGSVIGWMGDSGRTTGVHLHYEILNQKKPVNPLDYLP